MASADGHRLKCSFACSVKALTDPAERKLLGEVFLGRKPSVSGDDIVAHFAPPLQADAARIAASKNVGDWLTDENKTALADSLHKAADKIAFSCGVEILAPFQVDLESPSFQQQKIEAMERNLAEQRVAGQVEHLGKAAALLQQFDALRQSAPSLTAGEVLAQISPADQGTMLQTLLLAAGKQSGGQTPWAVAGPYLVRIDPHITPPKMELITLPARSAHCAACGRRRLTLSASCSSRAIGRDGRPSRHDFRTAAVYRPRHRLPDGLQPRRHLARQPLGLPRRRRHCPMGSRRSANAQSRLPTSTSPE